MIRDELPVADDCRLAGTLAMPVPPISRQEPSGSVYWRLMHEFDSALPAVVDDDGHPAGLVTRIALITHFAGRYIRDLFERRRIERLMQSDPLPIDADRSIDA